MDNLHFGAFKSYLVKSSVSRIMAQKFDGSSGKNPTVQKNKVSTS